MDGSIDTFTIVLLAVAVIIVLKLRSVLGRKTGEERPPFEPYRRAGPTPGAKKEAAPTMSRRAEDQGGTTATTLATK